MDNFKFFSIYFLLAAILTYSLVLNLGTSVTNPIDPLSYVWNLDHNFYALTHDLARLLDTNIFYPETNTLAYSDHLFGQTIVLFPLFFFIKNPLLIQNLYIIFTFILAGFGTFLLVKYLTQDSKAAFIAGIIYSFSLYHFDHLAQVPTTSIQWLPLALLYLFKAFDTAKTSSLLLFLFFFTLNFLSTIYYGVFLTLAAGLFVILKFREKKTIIKLALLSLPFILILLLFSLSYIRFHLENPEFRRTLEEASWRSANLTDYFRRKPLIHDRALFPGLTVFILAAGSFFIRKKSFSQIYFERQREKRAERVYFTLLLFFSFILSLGPEKWGIKLPYYYLDKVFPLMQAIRVPARFGILVILSLSVLAGITLSKFAKQANIIFIIFIIVILESFHIPLKLTKVSALSQAPPVYHWLAKQKQDFVILELPLRTGAHSNPIEEQVDRNYEKITEFDNFVAETFRMYFSILHHKKMINGYSSYFPPSYMKTAELMENFPSREAIELIKERKIKYLIIHTKQYGKRWKEIEKQLLNFPELGLVGKFAQDFVYIL